MHPQVLHWVGRSITESGIQISGATILEFGSLDINGSVRSVLQQNASLYLGVDVQAGPGVDVVADAETFSYPQEFDIVVCCEVFEHTPRWREIISNSHHLLRTGGLFISTMAGEGRPPHSAIDENPIRDWEYYANVGAWELKRCIQPLFAFYNIDYSGFDLRCWAVK